MLYLFHRSHNSPPQLPIVQDVNKSTMNPTLLSKSINILFLLKSIV